MTLLPQKFRSSSMRAYPKICSLVFLLVLCRGALTAQVHAPADTKGPDEAASELRTQKNDKDHQGATSSPQQTPAEQAASPVVTDTPELQHFMDQARMLLLRENFAELDKMADAVRSSKARFPGGGWKLSRFYEAVNNRDAGAYETDADWQSHLALLQRWTVARPQSIAARLTLADAYLRYAWAARGEGYANTVTDQDWRLFQERTKQAAKVLADAAALPSKCPHLYELAQEVALASGADMSQQRAIFEKAIAFEPLYFAYYQRYATALLPKWGASRGKRKRLPKRATAELGGSRARTSISRSLRISAAGVATFLPTGSLGKSSRKVLPHWKNSMG
jgi:hypothetical protein